MFGAVLLLGLTFAGLAQSPNIILILTDDQTGSLTDNAVQFIRHQAHTGAPFYLQVSHYAIHLSAEAKPATLARHKARTPGKVHTAYWYATMIDDLVVLDELQLTDYTYVFLTSDNGGTARQYPHFNKPLRAGKGSYYEGGLCVPFFAAGPGIKPGSYSSVRVVGYDLLSTFATWPDQPKNSPRALRAVPSSQSCSMAVGASFSGPGSGSIFIGARLGADSARPQARHTHRTKEIGLYDLAEVLSKTTNLAAAKPRLAKRVKAGLEDWIKEIAATTPSPLDRRPRRNPPRREQALALAQRYHRARLERVLGHVRERVEGTHRGHFLDGVFALVELTGIFVQHAARVEA